MCYRFHSSFSRLVVNPYDNFVFLIKTIDVAEGRYRNWDKRTIYLTVYCAVISLDVEFAYLHRNGVVIRIDKVQEVFYRTKRFKFDWRRASPAICVRHEVHIVGVVLERSSGSSDPTHIQIHCIFAERARRYQIHHGFNHMTLGGMALVNGYDP